MKEYRVFGPPGTGKTTYLANRLVPKAAHRHGPDNVMICSFTRAAAKEIATKKARFTNEYINEGDTIPIPDRMVGTLHSICFQALQSPKIIETDKKLIQMWNEAHPDMAIGGQQTGKASFDEVMTESNGGQSDYGDKLLAALNIKRNRMFTNKLLWGMDVQRFERNWEAFKENNGCFDFTDLIAVCLRDTPYAPGRPACFFVDEAQDMTRLQLSLVRKWAAETDELILVGDDDQAIYVWAGSSPDAFLDPPIPDNQKMLLAQSYRVPKLVLDRANSVIERVLEREPKIYQPRKDEAGNTVYGMVSECAADFRQPEAVVSWANDLAATGKTVMILATCSYMLEGCKRMMRTRGIPFSNRWRRGRPDWNPLYSPPSKNGRTSASDIIRAFIGMGSDPPYWDIAQFVTWAQYIKVGDTGLIKKRGKKGIEFLKKMLETPADPLLATSRMVLHPTDANDAIMTPAATERALARDLNWLSENLKSERANDSFEYIFSVGKNYGFERLFEEPKITLGTVHSVKGGEAAHVFLFPDISYNADQEMQDSKSGSDQAHRVFYVGMTRAKEELILCNPAVKKSTKSPRMYVPL